MVLICDICRQDISSTGGLNTSICLFPCFHKYCERCKTQTLNTGRQQNVAIDKVACKLCNQYFSLNVLYDYSENQIEKIFCLHCNIKNKATVEWSCKTCQNRFLCTQCSQPHYHSGHEIEPVMKPNIPFRSQCNAHSNVPATYLCSCQLRLCDYCLNVHANGQIASPHQQRIPFTKLAEQARVDLETIRRQTKSDSDKIQRFSETLARNKQQIHQQACQARIAVANEIVEVVNALLRRGNDLVMHIDKEEESKMKQFAHLEQEMSHWVDRLRKINSFTENALLTVQDDQPGLWSAAMFAQSAFTQVNKRRETAKQRIKNLEKAPNIRYQSDIAALTNAFNSFGLINVDNIAKIPPQSTSENARMFSISNANQLNPTANNVLTRQGGPSNATLRPPPLPIPNSAAVNVSITLPPPSQSQQRGTNKYPNTSQLQQTNVVTVTPQLHFNTTAVSSHSHQSQQHFAILPQLLQQHHQQIQMPPIPNCCIPSSSCSLPTTPVTPLPTAEQLQIMRQHAMMAAQQQGPIATISTMEQQQQRAAMMMAQAQQREPINEQQQQQAMIIQQQQQKQHQERMIRQQQHEQILIRAQQQAEQSSLSMASSSNSIQQQQLQFTQHQQHLHQQNQQQHHQRRHPFLNLQQQQQTHCLNSPTLQSAQNVETHTAERPPILLRIPNPNHQQQASTIHQNMNTTTTSSNNDIHIPRMNTPPQNITLTQILNSNGPSPNSNFPSSRQSIEIPSHFQTSSSAQLQQSIPTTSTQQIQQQEKRVPDVVDLLDDDEECLEINDKQNASISAAATTMIIEERYTDGGEQTISVNTAGQQQQGIAPQNRQKTQTAAADSTVHSTSTPPNNRSNSNARESVSPIVEPPASVAIKSASGIKRKPQESTSSEPICQKRQAIDEQYKNLDEQESAERTNMNTSPVVISSTTTTTENGEANPNVITAETSLDVKNNEENKQEKPEDKKNVQTNDSEISEDNPNPLVVPHKNTEFEQLQQPKQPSTAENDLGLSSRKDPEKIDDENDGTNNIVNDEEITKVAAVNKPNLTQIYVQENQQQRTQPPTKCAVVSPIQLMKMATLSQQKNSSSTSSSVENQKESTKEDRKNKKEEVAEDKANTTIPMNNDNSNDEGGSIPKLGDGSSDMWDDYCYVCSQGCDESTGSLGCCETCPHVFHANCHLPKIKGQMEDLPDDWRCSMCIECEQLNHMSHEFGEREKLLCAKVYLACFEENNQVEVFLNEVPKTEVDYHTVIKKPIWLYKIANKVNRKYENISEFVDDMNLLFKNFSTFNSPNVPLASNGKMVYSRYVGAMRKHLPAYQKQIWLYVSLYNARQLSTTSGDEDPQSSCPPRGVGRPPKKKKVASQTPI